MENEKGERRSVNYINGKDDQEEQLEEEEEEEKMEKFYALVRSFQEARNKRRNELKESDERRKKIRRLNEEKSSWVPSFQREDFTEEIQFRRAPIFFPSPCNINANKEDKKKQQMHDQEEDGALDLKLTL